MKFDPYFLPFRPLWLHFVTADACKHFLSNYEFNKIRCNESRTLLLRINENLFVLETFIARYGRNSV
jgi:hypothetical protein